MHRCSFAATAALLLLPLTQPPQTATPPPQPTQAQQRPVFRGGTHFVRVDAYPVRDGRIVEGLKPEDFEVLEDGKPQAVENFEFIKSPPFAVDAERRDPNTKEEGDRWADDPRVRVFVIYLDTVHTKFYGSHEARRPLTDFVRRVIGPMDLFGVMTPETPVGTSMRASEPRTPTSCHGASTSTRKGARC